jgi:hypothetical protein
MVVLSKEITQMWWTTFTFNLCAYLSQISKHNLQTLKITKTTLERLKFLELLTIQRLVGENKRLITLKSKQLSIQTLSKKSLALRPRQLSLYLQRTLILRIKQIQGHQIKMMRIWKEIRGRTRREVRLRKALKHQSRKMCRSLKLPRNEKSLKTSK